MIAEALKQQPPQPQIVASITIAATATNQIRVKAATADLYQALDLLTAGVNAVTQQLREKATKDSPLIVLPPGTHLPR